MRRGKGGEDRVIGARGGERVHGRWGKEREEETWLVGQEEEGTGWVGPDEGGGANHMCK